MYTRKKAFKKKQSAHIYIYIHTDRHAYMHTCIHTYIQTYRHTDIHPSMHACMHTCIHAYMHTCIHTCTHTYIDWYIHSDINICIYTYRYNMCGRREKDPAFEKTRPDFRIDGIGCGLGFRVHPLPYSSPPHLP